MEILKENLEKGYLVAKVDATDKFGVLREMGNVLVEKGWVKDTYPGAVIEREKVFPTGLPMEAMGVAIPHTDAIHVNKKAVFCEVIFMLTIMKPNDQIEMLSKLVETCQNVSVLQTVKAAEDMDTIEKVMEKLMA